MPLSLEATAAKVEVLEKKVERLEQALRDMDMRVNGLALDIERHKVGGRDGND